VIELSFLLDPPALILLGAAVFYLSKKTHMRKLWAFAAGVIIVTAFVVVSFLLYADIIRWYIPFVIDMKGSEWMFHSNITGVYKEDVHVFWVIVMFVLYPFWHCLGYRAAKYISKRLQLDKTVYNSSHVKSLKKPRTDAFAIKRGPEPRKILRECLSELGGIQNFVDRGDKVLVKVNICGGNPGRPGSFTTITITDELTKLIVEAGGNPMVVDADMIWTEFWPVATREGYTAWAKHGPPLVNLSETKLCYFAFGGVLQDRVISKEMLNSDVIISVPTMKTHFISGVTMGMKNMYGTLPQIDKAVYHRLGIEEVIFEVNKAFPPNLTIIDGTIGGEAMGPLSSEPVNFQTVVASGNVVVADAVACKLMGFNPLDIEHIKIAHNAGLGNADVELGGGFPPHEKDGCWVKPSLDAGKFYSEVIETVLQYPMAEAFFNVLADYMLYGTATLPIFKDLTPEFLFILNDIFDALKSGRKIPGK
jgi:uncharacterized protein (DUF362 family)